MEPYGSPDPRGGPKYLFRSQQGVPNIERFSVEGLEGLLKGLGPVLPDIYGDELRLPYPESTMHGGDPWEAVMLQDSRVGNVTYRRYVDAIRNRIDELQGNEFNQELGWPFQTEAPIQYPDRASMALASGGQAPYQLQQMQGPAYYGVGGIGRSMSGGGSQTGNVWGMMGTNRGSAYQGQMISPSSQSYSRVTGAYSLGSQSGPQ